MDGYRFKDNINDEVHEITHDDILELINQNNADKLQCEKITKESYNGGNFYDKTPHQRIAFYAETLFRDPKTSGFIMRYPHGTIVRQAERNHYYRGENQIYKTSVSKLLRILNQFSSKEEQEIYKFIADMRIAQFSTFIANFAHVKQWSQKYGDVLFEALAQHYGLETFWLDITNDFNVAIFFATCYFDDVENKWKPLTKAMIEKDENSRYGMIFHIPQWQASARNMFMVMPEMIDERGFSVDVNCILPLGFQPFMRCHMQYGYGIYMQKNLPLQSDKAFEKLKFRQSEKLSNEIYNLMNQGRLIYPHEGLTEFQDIIGIIKNSSVFTESDFEYAFEKCNYIFDRNECKKAICNSSILSNKIIIGKEAAYKILPKVIQEVNNKYRNFSIEKEYGIKLMSRLVYLPDATK